MYNNSPCCGSCSCNTGCDTSPCPTRCKGQVTEAELGTLIYLKGLDINLCPKYQAIANLLGFKDCNGVALVPGTQLVTCAGFQEHLCETFALLALGAPVTTGTVLIGADCQRHVMPAFQAPFTVADTNCLDLTLTGNVLSGAPIISPSVGNLIECTPSGLFADLDLTDLCPVLATIPVGAPATTGTPLLGIDCQTHAFPLFQAPIAVVDTSCIDLNLAGNVLSAIPIISPAAGNQVSCTPAGLFVPAAVPVDVAIVATDTSCLDLTILEGPANTFTISGIPVVSTASGNSLACTPAGLFVPTAAGLDVNIFADDTVTVDMTVVEGPANTFTVLADVIVSPVVGNILEIRPDGLAVTCTAVSACIPDVTILGTDTACIDVTVNEAPAGSFSISAIPIISPAAGNQVSCTPAGLFVPADVPLTVVDTATINLTASGVNNHTLQADAILTALATSGYPAGCNGLISTPTGLFAPPDLAGALGEMSLINMVDAGPVAAGASFTSGPLTLLINNPSLCREAMLTISLYIPATIIFEPVAPYIGTYLDLLFTHQFNLPSVLVTAPTTYSQFQVNGNNDIRAGSPPAIRTFNFIIPPNLSGSYTITTTAVINNACGGLFVGRVGSYYSLVTI